MKEFYCLKCGGKMIMTKAIGFYSLVDKIPFDYESESLYECLNKHCDMHYYFIDEVPYPYFRGRILYPTSQFRSIRSLNFS